MAKRAQPWFWEERGAWYVTMKGRRHPLGAHPDGAARPAKSKKTGRWNVPQEIGEAFRRLLSGEPAEPAGASPTGGDYVSVPLQAFLKWCKQNRAAKTTQRYFDFHHCELDTFANVHPRELELGALCMAALCFRVADLDAPLERGQVAEKPRH